MNQATARNNVGNFTGHSNKPSLIILTSTVSHVHRKRNRCHFTTANTGCECYYGAMINTARQRWANVTFNNKHAGRQCTRMEQPSMFAMPLHLPQTTHKIGHASCLCAQLCKVAHGSSDYKRKCTVIFPLSGNAWDDGVHFRTDTEPRTQRDRILLQLNFP